MNDPSNYHERILRVLVKLEQNLDSDLTLEELASWAHFSPYHFHRIFTTLVGEPVSTYMRRLRLERAASLLLHSTQSITEIARMSRYANPESFARAFAAMMGCSPSEFRTRLDQTRFSTDQTEDQIETRARQRLRPFGPQSIDAEIEERSSSIRVAFMRHVGPYENVGPTWGRLMQTMGPTIRPTTRYFGIGHDNPFVTEPARLRYDACITVADAFSESGDIGIQEILEGKHAVFLHRGPYHLFPATYEKIFGSWLPRSGFDPAQGPPVHEYLNRTGDCEPSDLRTRIHLPVFETSPPGDSKEL